MNLCVSAGGAWHPWKARTEGEELAETHSVNISGCAVCLGHSVVLVQGDPGQWGAAGKRGEEGSRGKPGDRGSTVGTKNETQSVCMVGNPARGWQC